MSDLSFQDGSAAFGVHYYYRLSAYDAAGNHSDYATADATTPVFTANTSTGASQKFSSDDSVAAVTIATGTFDSDSDCTVVTTTDKVALSGATVVAGPYQLICKDSSGNLLTAAKQPLQWAYMLGAKMKGYHNAKAVTLDSSGKQSITASTYNAKSAELDFKAAGLGTTAVLASAQPGVPWTALLFVMLFLLVIGGIGVLLLRRTQKQSYDEYIRSKYYDL